MKLVTFNNLIPSYCMKLIQWHDVEGLDVENQEDVDDQYSDEEDDEDELEEVASHVPNQVLQD